MKRTKSTCRRHRIWASAFAALGSLSLPAPALADANCGPAVLTRVLIYDNGQVLIYAPWRTDFVSICNLLQPWKGISPTVCWSWYATVNNSVQSGKRVFVYYYGIDQSECATMATYTGAPAPGYVEFNSP